MAIFTIVIYTLFGGMCIWFVISAIKKINQIKQDQQEAADEKEM